MDGTASLGRVVLPLANTIITWHVIDLITSLTDGYASTGLSDLRVYARGPAVSVQCPPRARPVPYSARPESAMGYWRRPSDNWVYLEVY